MAPTVDVMVITIFPWPLFTAVKDGQPLIGGKLYTFAASTSTPKASFADPFLVVPNQNPVVLNDQGEATVYLDGFYNLRLYDDTDVLLWSVDNYTFASSAPLPDPGEKIMGSTDATVTANGAAVIAVPGLVPTGYRAEGLVWTITTGFGSSNGVTEILVGDQNSNDRWARITNLAAGQTGGQKDFRSDTTPIEPIPYVILLSAISGNFDLVGQIHIRAYWSTLAADTVP